MNLNYIKMMMMHKARVTGQVMKHFNITYDNCTKLHKSLAIMSIKLNLRAQTHLSESSMLLVRIDDGLAFGSE